MTALLRPPPLSPGDEVVVVAPAGPVPRDAVSLGMRILEDRGFSVVWDEGIFEAWRYLAGPDPRRLAELTGALTRPGVRAVWAARGGYGTTRLLDAVPWDEVVAGQRRWLVGFSDVTALHSAWLAAGLGGAVHGPNVTTLGTIGGTDREQLFGVLSGSLPPPGQGAARLRTVVPGTAEGPLVGGNLSLVTRLVGTRFLPAMDGAVLLCEDVGERPYRVDRMLAHLRLAGVLDVVAGVVLGDFVDCEEPGGDYAVTEVLDDVLGGLGVPVVAGFPAGHGVRLRSLPLGVRVRVEAAEDEGRLEVLEPAWAEP